jgi:thiamine pyrophosphokinase
MGKCVIVGAGVCDVDDLKERLVINDGDMCIAADGGLDYLLKAKIQPCLVIGDMDSVENREKIEAFNTRLYPPQKDDTDMMLAIKEGLERGFKEFEIYGALGGRFDHSFANIQCLCYIIKHGATGRLWGDHGSFATMIENGEITFEGHKYALGRKISVFAYGQVACGVTERGLKYSLDNVDLEVDFPLGISNEFTGKDAYIKVSDGILMIYVD